MMPGSFTFALQFLNKQLVDGNTYTVHKINLSIKYFFIKYDQIRRIYITFTEEILKERVRFFFCSASKSYNELFWVILVSNSKNFFTIHAKLLFSFRLQRFCTENVVHDDL